MFIKGFKDLKYSLVDNKLIQMFYTYFIRLHSFCCISNNVLATLFQSCALHFWSKLH